MTRVKVECGSLTQALRYVFPCTVTNTNLEHLVELSKCACFLGFLSLLASIQLYVGGPPWQCMYSTIHKLSVYCTFSLVFGMELSNRLANIRRLSLGQPACKTQRKDRLLYSKFRCVPREGS